MGEQVIVHLAMIVEVVMVQVVQVVTIMKRMAMMVVMVMVPPQLALFFLHRDPRPVAHELI
jgi:hypothetical protein